MWHSEHVEGDNVCYEYIYIYICFHVFVCTSGGDMTVEIGELLDHRQTQSGKEIKGISRYS